MKPPRPNPKVQQKLVDDWNAEHLVGISVVVTRDDGAKKVTKTTSAAWLLGGHTAVILLEGISGAYSLARVKPQVMVI